MIDFRDTTNLDFLDKPVDKCMKKTLFQKSDKLIKFYEAKYKFRKKELRPFA